MVSILVPVYRAQAWISRCIESILAQRFSDWELLLIDDGSDDGSREICCRYAQQDGRIRVYSQAHQGVSAARNLGLAMAAGDAVTFCDADDWWEPDHLEGLVAAMRTSGAQIVSCNYRVVDETGGFLRAVRHPAGVTCLQEGDCRRAYILESVLEWKTGWEVWTRLFSGEMIRAHGLSFCESSGCGEDLAFVLTACLYAERVCAIAGETCCHRVHPRSIMAGSDAGAQLNGLNEAARHLWESVRRIPGMKACFPLIHYKMLRGTYGAIPAEAFPAALHAISARQWHDRQILHLLQSRSLEGENLARARFCIHQKPWRFRLEKCILSGDQKWQKTGYSIVRNLTCLRVFTKIDPKRKRKGE